jgi:nucleotide-binding universal stress UspA family protein
MPVDLSRPVETDVEYASSVATAIGADLHLLYVSDGRLPRSLPQQYWPCNFQVTVLEGGVIPGIAKHADAIDAHFMLMVSRRYGRWSRLWRRSVTEQVMRQSRRPVCITSAAAACEDFRFRHHRIACVVGLDGRETGLLRHAEELAVRGGAELVLLHVVPEPSEALLYHGLYADPRPLSRELAARDLSAVAQTLRVPAETAVLTGNSAQCIAREASRYSVDLVVMARARRGVDSSCTSDPEYVAGKLDCPLITVPVDGRASVQAIDETRAPVSWRSPSSRRAEAGSGLRS